MSDLTLEALRFQLPEGVLVVGHKEAGVVFRSKRGEVCTNFCRFASADDAADLETRAGYYRPMFEAWARDKRRGADLRGIPAMLLEDVAATQ